jgi:hypothetical protein
MLSNWLGGDFCPSAGTAAELYVMGAGSGVDWVLGFVPRVVLKNR